jgi:hypothetical protein
MKKSARVCWILACAVACSCSVYDESLLADGSTDPPTEGGTDDALVIDSSVPPDADDFDAAQPIDGQAPDSAIEAGGPDAGPDVGNPSDADARADAGSTADARDAAPDAPQPPRPTSIVLSGITTPSGQQSPPTMHGNAFGQNCLSNEVVIGYTATIDPPDASVHQLRTFQAVCGSLAVTGTSAFAVTTTTAETLPVVGLSPGDGQMQLCSPNEIVIGFSGRSGADIDQISFVCASLSISGTAPNYVLSVGTPNTLPPLGGNGGNSFGPISCPAGQVAAGNEGRAAYTINAFGLLCKTPALVLQ